MACRRVYNRTEYHCKKIEYDEKRHKYNKEQDDIRQSNLIKETGFTFIRIKEENWGDLMPRIILSKSDIEHIVKKKYKTENINWKIVKKVVEISFEIETEPESSEVLDKKKAELEKELKKEYLKKRQDGLMETGERVFSGRF